MYINLPFKVLFFKFNRPVNIVLNIGALEDICNEAQIEFHEIGDYINNNGLTFSRLLLYHGYVNACKYDRVRPKYTMKHAIRWANEITASEQVKLFTLIKTMFDNIKHTGEVINSKKKA